MSKIDDAMQEENPLYFLRDFRPTKKGDGILIKAYAIKGEEYVNIDIFCKIRKPEESADKVTAPRCKIVRDAHYGNKIAWVQIPAYEKLKEL